MKYNLLTIWSILVNLKNVPVESKASRVPITASPVAESGAATVVVKADIAACWLLTKSLPVDSLSSMDSAFPFLQESFSRI